MFDDQNIFLISQKRCSPIANEQWIKYNPQDSFFIDEVLEHHHINQGRWAIPLPQLLHNRAGFQHLWHD